jgi:cyd operon protein YbgT
MWYFSWMLGLGLACAFAVLNAMWFELRDDASSPDPRAAQPRDADGTFRS